MLDQLKKSRDRKIALRQVSLKISIEISGFYLRLNTDNDSYLYYSYFFMFSLFVN